MWHRHRLHELAVVLKSLELIWPELGSPGLCSQELGSQELGSSEHCSQKLVSQELGSPELRSPEFGSLKLGSSELESLEHITDLQPSQIQYVCKTGIYQNKCKVSSIRSDSALSHKWHNIKISCIFSALNFRFRGMVQKQQYGDWPDLLTLYPYLW